MKAIIKNEVADNHNEEIINFAQTIDFLELFEYVKGLTKTDCCFSQPEITTNRGDVYITFMSDDITHQTGAFSAILKHCYFQTFNNRAYKDKESDEFCYWAKISIRYKHKDGGSNGMDITDARYTENKGWEFY